MSEQSRRNSEQYNFYFRDLLDGVLKNCGLDPERYSVTPKPFNIDHPDGYKPRGFDLIDSQTNERIYLTSGSDKSAELKARNELGENVVLEHLDDLGSNRQYQQYRVPEEAQLFDELFYSPDVSAAYAQSLKNKAQGLLAKLHLCERSAFGANLKTIVVMDSGDATGDSAAQAVLAVVPPLQFNSDRYHPEFINQPPEATQS